MKIINNNKVIKNEKLKEIFNVRDIIFEKKTLEIFELIKTSLECVTVFLNSIDPMFNKGKIAWEDVNLIDDLIIIIGMVEYEPGTAVEIDGNLVTITKENSEYFQRIVHMSLPFDLVTSSNEEAIMEFLYELHNESQVITSEESIIQQQAFSNDFDLTKLTKKQQQALMMYNSRAKK